MTVRTLRFSCLLPSAFALLAVNAVNILLTVLLRAGALRRSLENVDPFLLGFAFIAAAAFTVGIGTLSGKSFGKGTSFAIVLTAGAVTVDRLTGRVPGAADLVMLLLGVYCLLRYGKRLREALPILILIRVLFQLAPWLGGGALVVLFVFCLYRLWIGELHWVVSSEVSETQFDCLLFLTVGSRAWTELTLLTTSQIAALLYMPTLLVFSAALCERSSPGSQESAHHALAIRPGSLGEYLAKVVHSVPPAWSDICDRLRCSTHAIASEEGEIRESEHTFLGFRLPDFRTALRPLVPEAVLFSMKVLSEHLHILGRSGSGKTSLGILPILITLIRGQERIEPRGVRVVSDPSAMVLIDLKGDKSFFNTAREEAKRRGQRFLFFTAEPDRPSYFFNPFTIFQTRRSSLPQQCQQLLDAMGFNNGEGYGRDHFLRIPRHYLLKALEDRPMPTSFQKLREMLSEKRPKNARAQYDSSDLEFAVESLCFYPQLFTTPEQERLHPESIINFERVFEERHVVYFWLPAVEESIAVREIGKLVLYNLLIAAKTRQDKNLKRILLYLFIDEFQRLFGESLQIILEQARSYGIGVVLSNHSSAQLRTASGRNLWPVIHGNTAATMHFGTADAEELKMLSDLSGETWRESMRTDTTTRSYGRSQSWRDVTEQGGIALMEGSTHELAPRMTTHDLLNIFSEPRQFLLHVYRNTGFSRFDGLPIAVKGMHCMDEETYKRRSEVIDWFSIEGAPSGILRNPAARVGETIPRDNMNAVIRDLFGAESPA